MGKHQTYRKRGTAPLSASTIVACPQPTFENIDDVGRQLAHCLGNDGGASALYSSPSKDPYTWSEFAATAWLANWAIEPWGSFPNGYYQPRQQGNGVNFTTDWVAGPIVQIDHA